jgi:glycerol-3-phosphate O-acyltransferase
VTPPARSGAAHAVAPEPSRHVQPADQPARKHLRVAPKVSRRVLRQRRRARIAIVGVAARSAASRFLLVTFHVFAVQSSFKLDKLENERAAAQRTNELLRNVVARRSSATAIFKGARALDMVRPINVVLLDIPPSAGDESGVVTAASTPVSMPETPYHELAAGP